ncbi:MAG: ferrous iron transport protein B [Bacteroides sp.]|nr:ferrous iron transport protein B [Bacteroides sp.]MCM1094658.1 ferrous iron transport protein B [Terasakiella sp.]
MLLSQLKTGQECVIVKILGHGAFRKRVMEMGFVRGRRVKVLLHAPMRDPIKYEVMGYDISLRRSEADLIEVEPVAVAETGARQGAGAAHGPHITPSSRKTINIALIGNPNCGKTSLFNIASGAREHVGNYSGVTVDVKEGTFVYKGYTFRIADLPGTYSLSSYSPEELYVRRYLHDRNPDVIVNVVAASNLERNLYLTTELIDMDRSMVIALNMYDELRASGSTLDYATLGQMIGVPMVPVVARDGEGINDLFDAIINVYEECHEEVRHVHVTLGKDVEGAVRALVDLLKRDRGVPGQFSPRYLAIKLLEGDAEVERMLAPVDGYAEIVAERDRLREQVESLSGEDIASHVSAEKYGFIAGALAETMQKGDGDESSSTSVIDAVVTNKLFGFPIFLLIMFFIFWATFFLGNYPMEWIESGVAALSGLVGRSMPDGILKDLVADGIIGGVGGVIVFLPNILILYFCISFMEDSGYMARAAFIMDKIMHRAGLHGKSFIPLVMGFGCNVPAIMATRAIESRSSRVITILINPFMSCSARLPLYALLAGTFFYAHAAWVFFGLYVTGIAVAVLTARLLRRFIFDKDETPFVMELPPYRMPTFRASMRHTWAKGQEYLRKMGGIILFASIVVWALNYFPRHDSAPAPDAPAGAAIDLKSDSFLAIAGKAVNPVMAPLGFGWRATVAALAGVPAKEIVVSTLGVLYTGDEAVTDSTLGERLREPAPGSASPDFTPAVALAFMVFVLLYCPCMATVTAIVRETHSWRWGAFSVVYNTAVAWLLGWLTYTVASALL